MTGWPWQVKVLWQRDIMACKTAVVTVSRRFPTLLVATGRVAMRLNGQRQLHRPHGRQQRRHQQNHQDLGA